MFIDEVIEREKRLAKENEDRIGEFDEDYSEKCKMWADEHRQIAEWLEDYKQIKMLIPLEKALQNEYNKGYADGSLSVTEEIKKKYVQEFADKLIDKYLDLIFSKKEMLMCDFYGCIEEVLEEMGLK